MNAMHKFGAISPVLLASHLAHAACDPADPDVIACLANELTATQEQLDAALDEIAALEAAVSDNTTDIGVTQSQLTNVLSLLTGTVMPLVRGVQSQTSAQAEDLADIAADYLTSTDLLGYASEAWVNEQDFGAVADLAAYVTVDAANDRITFEGANVYIQSGSGYTDDNTSVYAGGDGTGTLTGLGNLIIGYDESTQEVWGEKTPEEWLNDKTGSHNLIVGSFHSYPTAGGFVVGYLNTISGLYASISGGENNIASGESSAISGGFMGEASGYASSVGGGAFNAATQSWATVSGGENNIASGESSVVSGGELNEAGGDNSTVSGGIRNTATGATAVVSGGLSNLASAEGSSVTGGEVNVASGYASTVVGGSGITATVDHEVTP